MWPWIEDPDLDDVLVAKAEAMAGRPRPTVSNGPPTDSIDPRSAPLLAQRLCATEIPLAPGLNSAAHVGWLGRDMGQITTVTDARAILQANAFRDWLWFGTHRPLDGTQQRVFALVVGPRAAWGHRLALTDILDAVRRGRPTAEHRAAASRNLRDLGGRPGPAPTPDLWSERLARSRATGRVSATGDIRWTSRGL